MSAYDGAGFPHRTTFTSDQIQVIRHVIGNALCNLDPAMRCDNPKALCTELFYKYQSAMAKLEGMKI